MALVNPYATVVQVQAELRNTDATITTQIEDAINAASRWIDEWKGRDYYYHDYSSTALSLDKFDKAVYGGEIYLPYVPVITLTEVKVAGETWTADTDYVVKGNRIQALGGDWQSFLRGLPPQPTPAWPVGEPPDNTIAIKGTFGYVQATSADVPTGLPSIINRACILCAAALSGHNQKEVLGLDGTKQEVVDKTIPKTVMDLLGPKGRIMI